MKKLLLIPVLALACSANLAHAAVGSACTLNSDCGSDAPYCNFTTFKCQVAATTGADVAPNPSTSAPGGTGTNVSGFVPLAPIPNLTSGTSNVTASTLSTFLDNLYKYLIGLAAVLAVIEIAYGGIEIATNREDASKITDSKGRIMQAILGLVLVLLPVLVFSIINPSILSLSIDLPSLKTQSTSQGASLGSGSTAPTQTTTNASGVTQSVSGTYMQTATFASNNPDANNSAAQAWVAQCTQQGNLWGGVLISSSCTTYTNGVCQNPPSAVAQCMLKPSASYTFVDVETGFFGSIQAGAGYSLKAVDNAGSQYLSSCQSDHGIACIQTLPAAQSCPSGLTLPANAPNAKSGGNCYAVTPACAPTQSGSIVGISTGAHINPAVGSFCRGDVTFTQ